MGFLEKSWVEEFLWMYLSYFLGSDVLLLLLGFLGFFSLFCLSNNSAWGAFCDGFIGFDLNSSFANLRLRLIRIELLSLLLKSLL
jgi:hypothetical protein